MKNDRLLPESLRYLQPFVDSLARIKPKKRNEDIDPTALEEALRQRLHGGDAATAQAILDADRTNLDAWLRTAGGDHPAHWVLGFLSLPDLAAQLLQPPEPFPQPPRIDLEAPEGWTMKATPFELQLKKGKLVAVISAREETFFHIAQRQQEYWPAELPFTREVFEVVFGPCVGKKYVLQQPFKRVDYLLTVPGGFVSIFMSAVKGGFDETPLEARLPTLRISRAP